MEINRNQYFAIGVVVLLLGIQFRWIESFTLNSESTKFIRTRVKKNSADLVDRNSSMNSYFAPPTIPSNITIKPPKWIGWALLSTGGVLVLHSFAMRRPE